MATLEAVVEELQNLNKVEENLVGDLLIEQAAGIENMRETLESIFGVLKEQFAYQKMQDIERARQEEIDQQKSDDSTPTPSTPPTPGTPQKIETPDNIFGFLTGGLGLASAALIGVVEGVVTQIRAIVKTIKGAGKGFNLIPKQIKEALTLIRSYFGMFVNTVTDLAKGARNAFKGYVSKFTKAVTNFLLIGDDLAKVGGGVRSAMAGISSGGGFLKSVTDAVKSVFRFFKSLQGVFRALGNVLGKLFLPITVIMGIFDGIKGAVTGFQEESGNMLQKILGGLFGAIKEISANLIALPLDLLKGAVSWILDKVGLDFVSDMLDEFSFEDIFRTLFDTFAGAIIHPIETLKKVLEWVKGKVSGGIKKIKSFFGFGDDEETKQPERLSDRERKTLETIRDAREEGVQRLVAQGYTQEEAQRIAESGRFDPAKNRRNTRKMSTQEINERLQSLRTETTVNTTESAVEQKTYRYDVTDPVTGKVIDSAGTPEEAAQIAMQTGGVIQNPVEINNSTSVERALNTSSISSPTSISQSTLLGGSSASSESISQSSDREVIESALVAETNRLQEKRAMESSSATVVAPVMAATDNSTHVNNQTINAGPMPSAMDRSDRTNRRGPYRGRG